MHFPELVCYFRETTPIMLNATLNWDNNVGIPDMSELAASSVLAW